MSDIYVFSGLGADERVFRNIQFGEHSVVFIKWIIPDKNEEIESYAMRIIQQIHSSDPILIGLSFGGIMALEVAKKLDVNRVILISSAKNKFEIPWFYRIAGKMRIHKLLPVRLMNKANFITYWLFGTRNQEERDLLKQILKETDKVYLNWAIHQIATWKNLDFPENTFHIHGSKDRLLPKPKAKVDKIISDGGHFMILNKSQEINRELYEKLSN